MIFGPHHRRGIREIREQASHQRNISRIVALACVGLVAFGVITARLVELTVVQGAQNRTRADENRFFVRPISAARGVILDRAGEALTRNVPGTTLIDYPGDNAGPVEAENVRRVYPLASIFSHVVGYVGIVDAETLSGCQKSSGCALDSTSIVGKMGLEKRYDDTLRGRAGSELIEVDANGKFVRQLGQNPPISGKDLPTTLDRPLQEASTRALAPAGRRGAVVAIDPGDGAVLALVSSPNFDQNLFADDTDPARNDKIQKLLSDHDNLPLFNRAVGGEYPPGSIFKLVTASAGLSEGKVTSDTTIEDTGEIRIGDFRYGNWYFDQYGRKEGIIGLSRALTRSNDIFFYKVGEWLGPEKLALWARKLGLGAKTDLDTTGESDGLVPDPLWKERVMGERWFLGDTYHTAIGQGDVQVTPIQIGQMAAAVVSGKKCVPHIAIQATSRAYGEPGLRRATSQKENRCEDAGISDANRALILEGMVGACSNGGTAYPLFDWNAAAQKNEKPLVGCKTGTAQHGGEKAKPHAWIVVTGPVTNEKGNYQLDLESEKRIVLVVLLEDAGEGSTEAAPVAKEILEKWFEEKT